jgi:hypothetical protein
LVVKSNGGGSEGDGKTESGSSGESRAIRVGKFDDSRDLVTGLVGSCISCGLDNKLLGIVVDSESLRRYRHNLVEDSQGEVTSSGVGGDLVSKGDGSLGCEG